MLFWRKGYEATSMQDLVDTLEINRYSIYNTFGDKQALFELCLEYYEGRVFAHLLEALQPLEAGLPSLEHYLDTFTQALGNQSKVSGCLLQKSLLEGGVEDEQILARIRQNFMQLRDFFEELIEHARVQGQIDKQADSAALADFMLLQVQGLIALSSVNRESFEQAAEVLKQQLRLW